MASASTCARSASAAGDASPVPGGRGAAAESSSSRIASMRSTRCCRSRAWVCAMRCAVFAASAAATWALLPASKAATFSSSSARAAWKAMEALKYARAATSRRSRPSSRSLRRMPGTRTPSSSVRDRVELNDRRLRGSAGTVVVRGARTILSEGPHGDSGVVRYRTPGIPAGRTVRVSAGRRARARWSTGRRIPARCRRARRARAATR